MTFLWISWFGSQYWFMDEEDDMVGSTVEAERDRTDEIRKYRGRASPIFIIACPLSSRPCWESHLPGCLYHL